MVDVRPDSTFSFLQVIGKDRMTAKRFMGFTGLFALLVASATALVGCDGGAGTAGSGPAETVVPAPGTVDLEHEGETPAEKAN